MNKEILNNLVILYIEDEDDIREFTFKTLSSIVKKVFVSKNGAEALEIYKNNKDINLILTDINIPKIGGLEVCEEIRKEDSSIPLIITSAHSDHFFLKKAIDLNVSSYVLKPVDLYQLVQNMIRASEPLFLKKELESVNIELENKIQDEKKEIKHILDTQKNMILLIEDEKIIEVNKSFQEFFLIEDQDKFLSEFDTLYKIFNSKSFFEPYLNISQTDDIEKFKKLDDLNKIVKVKNDDDNELSFLINIDKIENEKNRYIVTLLDITQINEKLNLLDFQANHDGLTGLFNYNKFKDILSKEIRRDKRYGNNLSIIAFDINDLENKPVDDEVLKETSEIVLNNIREFDSIGRWNDFNFLIILPQTKIDGAQYVSEKIKTNILKNKLFIDNKLNVSFGITVLNKEDEIETIIKRVKLSLDEAKKRGNNCINCS